MEAGQNLDDVVVPTGRHGLPADVVADHQRERILAAMIALTGTRGYGATTVLAIGKAAKVGPHAFYAHFSDKEECFLAALSRVVSDTRDELTRQVPAESSWAEQICDGLRTLVGLIVAEPERARVVLVEAQGAGRAAYRLYEEAMDEAVPKLAEGRGLRAKGAPALSAATEEATLTGVAWLLQRMVSGGEEPEPT